MSDAASEDWYENIYVPEQEKQLTAKQLYDRQYYQKNKEERNKKRAEWAIKNKDKVYSTNKEWHLNNPEKSFLIRQRKELKYRTAHFNKQLLKNAKNSALRKGLDFDLELSDIIIPDICPILGIPLINPEEFYTPYHKAVPSIDRKDSSKGYTKDNIWIISYLANRMKSEASTEELLLFSRGILNCVDKGIL